MRHRGEAGFTVIEFVIAIALFVPVIVPITQLMISTSRLSGNTRSRVTAAYLAAQGVEQARSTSNLAGGTFWTGLHEGTTSSKSGIYTIAQTLEWVGQSQTTSGCSAGGGTTPAELIRVTESVTWPNMSGTAPVTSVSDLAPPDGTFSASTGAAGVQVSNAANQPDQGATITITSSVLTGGGSYSQSIVTGSDGCGFFAFIPAGTYTASATAPTQVSNQEATTATSGSFSVTAGKTFEVPTLQLDVGGTILVTSPSGPPPPATVGVSTLPYSVHYSSLTPYALASFPAATTSLKPLFPFPGGYVPFAGNCTDSDPLGQNTSLASFYTGSTAPPAQAIQPVATVAPGTTPTATSVGLYPLSLSIANPNNRVVSSITATPTTATGTPHPTWTGSINWVCPVTPLPVYKLALPSAGSSVTAIGLGHYTIQVTTTQPVTTTIYVWVEPDGSHLMSGTGTPGAAGPATVTLP